MMELVGIQSYAGAKEGLEKVPVGGRGRRRSDHPLAATAAPGVLATSHGHPRTSQPVTAGRRPFQSEDVQRPGTATAFRPP